MQKGTFFKVVLVLIPLGMVFMPLAASAASAVTAPNIWGLPPGWWAPTGIISCTGNYPLNGSGGQNADATGKPYCTDLNDLLQTFINVIYLAMSIALFILAPILFLVGAIMFMMAGANPEMLTKGRQTMISVAVGIVIVLCSYLIVSTVIGVFHITGVTGFSPAAAPATPTTP